MTQNQTIYRIALAGLGNVGSAVLTILQREQAALRQRYGVQFLLTGVVELGGGAIADQGLDINVLLEALHTQKPVAKLAQVGRPGLTALDLIEQAKPDFLLEATPVNLEDGQPGLSVVKAALKQGIHVILANKGPMALAYRELAALSDLQAGWGSIFDPTINLKQWPKLRFSACVAGALPTINLGWRDLAGTKITRLEAVLNGTTQYILRAMEQGQSYGAALLDAQERGIAETDPALDVDGFDAAAKLVIVANAVLGQATCLTDVDIMGIRSLTHDSMQVALNNNQRIVLVCLAEWVGDRYQFSVRPTPLSLDHPLTRITPDEMAVVFYSQDVEQLFVSSSEPSATPAAAAMIRDLLDIIRTL